MGFGWVGGAEQEGAAARARVGAGMSRGKSGVGYGRVE